MITIKQLEALQNVARLGTISRAAARLCTTESALSKRIQDLEHAIGAEIFDRRERALRLNDVGTEVLRLATTLLGARDAILEVGHGERALARTFRFGMTELISHLSLIAMVNEMKRAFPQVRIEPRVGMTFDLLKDLEQGDLDLAIVPVPTLRQNFKSVDLFEVNSTWVCSPVFMPQPKPLSAVELSTLPLILQPTTSARNLHIAQWFAYHHVETPRFVSCNSLEGLKNLALAGFGVALLPDRYCSHELRDGRLIALDVAPSLDPLIYGAVSRIELNQSRFVDDMALVIRNVLQLPEHLG